MQIEIEPQLWASGNYNFTQFGEDQDDDDVLEDWKELCDRNMRRQATQSGTYYHVSHCVQAPINQKRTLTGHSARYNCSLSLPSGQALASLS